MEEEKQEQEIKDENKQTAEVENKELNDKADEIIKLKQELEEKDDRLKRLMAEFENFKKRSSKEREFLYSSILGDIVNSLLPVLDNLENAACAETADENYKQGVELVLKQFKDVLSANNVQEIEGCRRNI